MAEVTVAVPAEASMPPISSKSKIWVHELCSIAAAQLKPCSELSLTDLNGIPETRLFLLKTFYLPELLDTLQCCQVRQQ